MSAIKHYRHSEILGGSEEPEPIVDCTNCMNYGCIFCLPSKPQPEADERDWGIDPFEGEDHEGQPAAEWTDEAADAHARETHAKVLAGELPWNAVYGDDNFDPFA
jgi:hypothetical protein